MSRSVDSKADIELIEDAGTSGGSREDFSQKGIVGNETKLEDLNSVDGTVTPDSEDLPDDYSDINESKVIRKIDWRLLPVITVLYLLSYMDRTNIGNARIEGITEDLNLTNNQFSLCVMVFFLFYSAFEIPSNMLLKYLGKHTVFIPTIMLLWGIIMTMMGLVKTFEQLFALRVLLGIFEAGLYPGVTYSLTMFYKRSDMLSRHCIFYCGSSSAGAFSGLLAFAIAKMDGVGGYGGWRWIFILEGLLTVVVAIACYWILIDYPKDCKFLTQREKDFINWRLKNDIDVDETKKTSKGIDVFRNVKRNRPVFTNFTDADDISMKKAFFSVFQSFQTYLFVLMYWGTIIPNYGISLTAPSVIKGLGYTSSQAQLMTIPIYLVGSAWSLTQSFLSDRLGKRSPFIIVYITVAIMGFTMMVVGEAKKKYPVVYAGLFLAAIGMITMFPTMIIWFANNVTNNKRRAISIATQIGLGNFGGAPASYIYNSGFLTGHYIVLAFGLWTLFTASLMTIAYLYLNRRDLQALEDGKFDDYSDLELYRMGDKSPYFRYIL